MGRFAFLPSLGGAYAIWLAALLVTFRLISPA
jgi:hypothetical protein